MIGSRYASSVLEKAAHVSSRSLGLILTGRGPNKSREIDSDGVDLIKKLLKFNPYKRLTACEALKHPYVAKYVCVCLLA